MIKKVLLIVMDGLGDRPVEVLGGKTPLEAANTPNFDALVKKSQCGLMYTLGRGKRPGSDTAHLSILGYPIQEYYNGRGPIEAAGVGIKLKAGDVAFRGNFGTVDSSWNCIDRRAGRITNVAPFAKALDGTIIDGVEFIVKPGSAYRAGVVMRGVGLSANVSDADSHNAGDNIHAVVPKDNTKEAKHTANVLNKFMKYSYEVLDKLPENKKLEEQGKLKANFLLLRGAGKFVTLPKFSQKWGFKNAACIAGGGLYKGIGAFLGMDLINVNGANAQVNTNLEGKFNAAINALNEYDFVFLHIKPTDSLAEDGKPIEKREFIEKIDKYISLLNKVDNETLIVITADHSTACELKAHTADSVPVMFYCNGIRNDNITKFGERDFAKGSLGILEGKDIMPNILNIMGKLPIIGA
ncbi:MAG: 2,3-bisphosphoglycerate-independent phosphoglycerate mutase [Clostridiales bacterium]|nr:2,3-bisphosphoglycerate-independent phosphoglycerate mutase [Clostridiales bacterium]